MKKVMIKYVFCLLFLLIILLAGGVAVLWRNEIRSAMSIKQLSAADPGHRDGAVYEMTVYGKYGLEDYIRQGGTSDEEDFKKFAAKLLGKGLFKVSTGNAKVTGCSSFTGSLENGGRILARNYDLRETSTCIVHTRPGDGRHSSVSSVDLKFLGVKAAGIGSVVDRLKCSLAPYLPVDGMNDAGLACAIHMSYQEGLTDQNTQKPDTAATILMRMMLDYADSVEEAVEIAEKYDMHDLGGSTYQIIVADSTGRSAVLNWTAGSNALDASEAPRQLAVTYNEGSSQLITNFVIIDGYYDEGDEKKGMDRYEILRNILLENGGIFGSENDAMEGLHAASKRNLLGPESVKITVHSAVYNLTDRTAVWIGNEHYGEEDRLVRLSVD